MGTSEQSEIIAEIRSLATRAPGIIPVLFTPAQAAQYLGISTRLLRRLKSDGKINRAAVEGFTRYHKTELDHYASAGSTGIQYKTPRVRKASQ